MPWSKSDVFTVSGPWIAPPGVKLAMLVMMGGGAPAANNSSGGSGIAPGFPGGTGELVIGQMVSVIPGNSYNVVVGAGGTNPAAGNSTSPGGTNTTFDSVFRACGAPGFSGGNGAGLVGAGPGGGGGNFSPIGANNQPANWRPRYESPVHAAGLPGSWYDNSVGVNDLRAGTAYSFDCIGVNGTNQPSPLAQAGRCGGGTIWPKGGTGGNGGTSTTGGAGSGYGCGGGAGGTIISGANKGGNGKDGYVAIFYN